MENQVSKHTLYLDCSSGISGDMVVAALLDLGANPDVLQTALASLPLQGYRIEITDVIKSGLKSKDFNVILEFDNHDHDMAYLHHPDAKSAHHTHPHQERLEPEIDHHTHPHQECLELENDHHTHPHQERLEPEIDHHTHPHQERLELENDHHTHPHQERLELENNHHTHPEQGGPWQEPHHHHHGRSLLDIRKLLSAGSLTPNALKLALKIFQIVAEAEGQVHGKSPEEVHFHEVGAVDSIVDIAAAAICLDNLGIEKVIVPRLTEGSGQVRCQHGLLPIPVPATTAILSAYGLPLHILPIQGELVTPTGAAIAAAIRTDSQLPGEFKILRTGIGAGKRIYETAGVLRAMLIEETSNQHDSVLVMETNLDDCTGETMGFVMEELLDAGALDVFYTPIYMKKHRPAYQLTLLCPLEKRPAMEEVIFRHSTTIGLRFYEVQRTKLPRKIISLETPWGMADIKCCQFGEELYYYPESDSILQLSKVSGKSYSELYHEVKIYAENHYQLS